MAQYKIKKGHELTSICVGKRKYVLFECSEQELENLFETVGANFIDKIEPKKESKKVSKKEESLEDEQGE